MSRMVYAVTKQCGDGKYSREYVYGIYAELSAANADAIQLMNTNGQNSMVLDKETSLFWHNVRPNKLGEYYLLYYVQAYKVRTKSLRG